MSREFISLKEVFGPTGNVRLQLMNESDEEGYEEFHTLRWEILTATGWLTKVSVSDDQFQGAHQYHRWVTDLHSIRSETGLAVIMVAESNLSPDALFIDYLYSWRLWNIVENSEVVRLKDCQTNSDLLVYQ